MGRWDVTKPFQKQNRQRYRKHMEERTPNKEAARMKEQQEEKHLIAE